MRGATRSPMGWLGVTARSVTAVAVLAAVVIGVSPGAAGGQEAPAGEGLEVRVAARRHDDGRVEVGVQWRDGDRRWGSRVLAQRRYVPADAAVGRWLASAPVAVPGAVIGVLARRHGDGRVEVGVQWRDGDRRWGSRVLAQRRFVPADAAAGRWLVTTPLPAPDWPDAGRQPAALVTATGVPVVVLGRASGGFVVRTPCAGTAIVAGGEPIEGAQVVVDPGHGGPWASGAVGPNGLAERDLNLTLSRAVLRALADRGIPAATTRTGDYGLRLSVRAEFADALGVDAFISLHHNAPTWGTSEVPGSEVYVQSATSGGARASSARLGGLLYEKITAALGGFEDITWSRLPNAGVLRVLAPQGGDAYAMVSRPSTTAVLVEYGYLSNPPEAELFATDAYIHTAATATADAIDAYLHTDRNGSGHVEQPRVYDPATPRPRCNETPLQ